MTRLSRGTIVLTVGLGSVATLLGYITGAASTSIAGTVATSVLVIASTGVSAFTAFSASQRLSTLPITVHPGEPPETIDETLYGQYKEELGNSLSGMGIALLVFALMFYFGILQGTRARTDGYFRGHYLGRSLPWSNMRPPSTPAVALIWLGVQDQMLNRGYTEAQVKEVYRLNLDYWARQAKIDSKDMREILGLKGFTPEQAEQIYQIFGEKWHFNAVSEEEEAKNLAVALSGQTGQATPPADRGLLVPEIRR